MKTSFAQIALFIIVISSLTPSLPTYAQEGEEISRPWDIEWGSDGEILAVAGNFGLAFYDSNFQFLRLVTNQPVNLIDWSSDGAFLVTSTYSTNATINILDMQTEQLITTITVPTGFLWDIAISPDNQQVVAVTYDQGLYVYDIASQSLVFNFIGSSEFEDAQWSPNNRYFVAIDRNDISEMDDSAMLYVWDAQTYDLEFSRDLSANEGVLSWVSKLAWHPNNPTVLAFGGYASKGTILALDIASEAISGLYARPIEPITFLGWSPDGTQFAASEAGITVSAIYLWDANSDDLIWSQRLPNGRDAYQNGVWKPDGSQIAILLKTFVDNSPDDVSVHILDATSGAEIDVLALPPVTSTP